MSNSNLDFSAKFFRPPQRTVSCHNGLISTRTKHTIAQDRFIIAEQRKLESERRKSASNLQLLAFEQKQLEKRLSSLHSLDHHIQKHHRSISEANLQQINELSTSLNHSNQNYLSLPKTSDFQRRFSGSSDGYTSENPIFTSDPDSDEEENKKSIQILPIVAIIPPEDDNLYLIQ